MTIIQIYLKCFVFEGYIVLHDFFKKNITQYNADAPNTHVHSPYKYTNANPTPTSTSKGLSTDISRDSWSHHWRLVVHGNITYQLTLHSTTQTLTTRTHTHPYEYMYANPTLMSTDRSRDSQSHHWRLVVDGNVAYHLTHNAGKSWKSRKRCENQDLNSGR
jgi:DMSO/TMAO reductase YedYZ molybdopterin-dependent catalytic subunit